jgi:hypothetical protein
MHPRQWWNGGALRFVGNRLQRLTLCQSGIRAHGQAEECGFVDQRGRQKKEILACLRASKASCLQRDAGVQGLENCRWCDNVALCFLPATSFCRVARTPPHWRGPRSRPRATMLPPQPWCPECAAAWALRMFPYMLCRAGC